MEQETRRYNDAEKLQIIEEYMNPKVVIQDFGNIIHVCRCICHERLSDHLKIGIDSDESIMRSQFCLRDTA